MNQQIFADIGLTKGEIAVYLSLFELGSSSVGPIIDKAKVSSSKVYDILERLIDKGLVSYVIKAGTKHFEAGDPESILQFLDKKEERISLQKKEMISIIPELKLKQQLAGAKSQATIFKGVKGLKTAFDDVLKNMKKGEEYHVLGASKISGQLSRFLSNYHMRRSKRGIKVKMLFSEQGKDWAEKIGRLPHTRIKYVQSQILTSSSVLIYKNKTQITVSSNEDITVFRIESQAVADSFRSQFETLWKQDTTIRRGIDAVGDVFREMVESGHGDFIGAHGYYLDQRPKFVEELKKRAKKNGFTMRNIVKPGFKHVITELPFAKTKDTLQEEFTELSVFWIYGNKVAISNWTETEPIIIIIDNKSINSMYRKQFELLWKK